MAAPITLPKRSPGRDPGRVGQKVPDAGNVPQIAQASDPGLKIPNFGIDLEGIIEPFRKEEERKLRLAEAAAKRQQKLVDATAQTEATNAFETSARTRALEIEQTGDKADPNFVSSYIKDLDKYQAEQQAVIDGNKSLSPEASATANLNILKSRGAFEQAARLQHVKALVKKGDDAKASLINKRVAQATQNPGMLEDILNLGKQDLIPYKGTANADKERDDDAKMRASILDGAIKGLAETNPDAALALINDKKYENDLKPEVQSRLRKEIESEKKERVREARLAVTRARQARLDAEKAAREATASDFLERQTDPVKSKENPLTRKDVLKSNLSPAGKRTFLTSLDKEAKGLEKKTNEVLYNTQFSAIANGEITPTNFNDRVLPLLGKGIEAADYKRLQSFAEGVEKDQGAPIKSFLSMAKAQITGTNLVQNDPVGDRKFFEFSVVLQARLDEERKKGKDGIPIRELLDPNSKDYIGTMINSYIRTPAEQMHDMGNRMRGGRVIP